MFTDINDFETQEINGGALYFPIIPVKSQVFSIISKLASNIFSFLLNYI